MVFVRVLTLPYHSAGPKNTDSIFAVCIFFATREILNNATEGL